MYPNSDLNLNYETNDAIYWFSHAFDPLNNWSAHSVNIWGKVFPTVEHGYHYRKFSETAPKIADLIQLAPSPWAAMQIERQHKQKRRSDWQDVKVGIMTELVIAKVRQNKDVLECLIKTGNKQIIENSPWDTFWGVGENGSGRNQMGEILMMIREEIKDN
jgi:ribA/ribD-fused uncharacterized protein